MGLDHINYDANDKKNLKLDYTLTILSVIPIGNSFLMTIDSNKLALVSITNSNFQQIIFSRHLIFKATREYYITVIKKKLELLLGLKTMLGICGMGKLDFLLTVSSNVDYDIPCRVMTRTKLPVNFQ